MNLHLLLLNSSVVLRVKTSRWLMPSDIAITVTVITSDVQKSVWANFVRNSQIDFARAHAPASVVLARARPYVRASYEAVWIDIS